MAQSAALLATAGTAADSLGGDQEGVAPDMQTLVDYFNKVFDLYGRQVVLKVYNGQGDFLAEFQNQNIQGAQADGARARDQRAFADVSIVTMTQPYSEALVSQGIIAMSPVYLSDGWYAAHAPYAFGVSRRSGTQVGTFMGNVACQRLAGGNATFAGDDALRGRHASSGSSIRRTPSSRSSAMSSTVPFGRAVTPRRAASPTRSTSPPPRTNTPTPSPR